MKTFMFLKGDFYALYKERILVNYRSLSHTTYKTYASILFLLHSTVCSITDRRVRVCLSQTIFISIERSVIWYAFRNVHFVHLANSDVVQFSVVPSDRPKWEDIFVRGENMIYFRKSLRFMFAAFFLPCNTTRWYSRMKSKMKNNLKTIQRKLWLIKDIWNADNCCLFFGVCASDSLGSLHDTCRNLILWSFFLLILRQMPLLILL